MEKVNFNSLPIPKRKEVMGEVVHFPDSTFGVSCWEWLAEVSLLFSTFLDCAESDQYPPREGDLRKWRERRAQAEAAKVGANAAKVNT
jgi:hypothetical protein